MTGTEEKEMIFLDWAPGFGETISPQCIYGKFFHKKTGYISVEWFPHFANYRREGYDFDALYDDGHGQETD